jgi:hypothetical protein
MKRWKLAAAALGVALALLVPQTASAAVKPKPVRSPSPAFIGTFDPGLVCPFAVYTEPVGPTQTQTVYFDRTGNVVKIAFRGPAKTLLRNVDTGKTLIEDAGGPGTLLVQPDGSLLGSGGGAGLFALFPGDDRGPALLAVVGHETFTVTAPDANHVTHIVDLNIHGNVTDLCAALAA